MCRRSKCYYPISTSGYAKVWKTVFPLACGQKCSLCLCILWIISSLMHTGTVPRTQLILSHGSSSSSAWLHAQSLTMLAGCRVTANAMSLFHCLPSGNERPRWHLSPYTCIYKWSTYVEITCRIVRLKWCKIWFSKDVNLGRHIVDE